MINDEDVVKDELEDSGTEVSEDGRVTVVEADVHNAHAQVGGVDSGVGGMDCGVGGVDSGTSFSSRENTPRGGRGDKDHDDIVTGAGEVNGVNA